MRVLLSVVLALVSAAGAAGQESYLVVIGGLAGEPQYADTFHHWGASLVDAARSRYGLADDNIVFLAERPERDPARIDGKATRDGIAAALTDLSRRAKPGDQVLVVLIGHGSFAAGEGRLNLPGPDLSATDLTRYLALFRSQKVAVANTASASGAFLPALAAKGRVVVTATRSGGEQNETVFGRFFVNAFAGDGADTDKNGRVSLLEAFDYARREVARTYQTSNRLQTEHALLEDDGDGKGTAEPDGRTADGALARGFYLGTGGRAAVAAVSAADPALRALMEEKRALEEQIERLRAAKEGMDSVSYARELERLLVELALKNQAIRKAEGKNP